MNLCKPKQRGIITRISPVDKQLHGNFKLKLQENLGPFVIDSLQCMHIKHKLLHKYSFEAIFMFSQDSKE